MTDLVSTSQADEALVTRIKELETKLAKQPRKPLPLWALDLVGSGLFSTAPATMAYWCANELNASSAFTIVFWVAFSVSYLARGAWRQQARERAKDLHRCGRWPAVE